MKYLRFLQDFAGHYDEEIDDFVKTFKEELKTALSLNTMVVSTTGRSQVMDIIDRYQKKAEEVLNPENDLPAAEIKLDKEVKNEGFKSASKVNFVSEVGNFKDHGLKYSGAFHILKVALSYDYLWINIRVKGGAYGCGAN